MSSVPPPDDTLWPRLYTPEHAEDTPESVFRPGLTPRWDHCDRCVLDSDRCDRLVSIRDPHAILIYVDGSCLGNGTDNASAGVGMVHTYDRETKELTGVGYPLECEGPEGDWYEPESNRAELRAAIMALEYRDWANENVRRLVIATDSEYVARGCTEWAYDWEENDWYNNQGYDVYDQDLWRLALEIFDDLSDQGVQVEFWRIPREWNTLADEYAKDGAEMPEEWYWDDSY